VAIEGKYLAIGNQQRFKNSVSYGETVVENIDARRACWGNLAIDEILQLSHY